ncbi:MAG TPA: M1 family aminopeptidase [Candidatus Acidoferrales bacterium]|nr:M1 family aminopeptidase [Candidatus Acidoferrales bacterium]
MAAASASHPVDSPQRKTYAELNTLRVDRSRIYQVRQFALRRDAVRLVLEDGTLGLLEPFHGRVLGAVFSGNARVLATPREPAERRSLSRFLGTPLLDRTISKAYLRFTDDTGEQIEAFLRSSGARPVEDPAFLSDWNPVVANLNPSSSLRTLRDVESTSPLPFFNAMLVSSQLGVFEVSVDDRRQEQVLLGQVKYREGGRYYDLWAMFPRAEGPGAPDPAAAVRYSIDTTLGEDLGLQGKTRIVLRAVRGGERMIPLILSRGLRVQSVTDASGQSLDFFQNEDLSQQQAMRSGNDLFFVVLPEPTREGQEFQWDVSYNGSVITASGNKVFYVGERGTWYPRPSDAPSFCPIELSFRWPKKLSLVATGRKTEEHADGEMQVSHWVSEAPMAFAGFNLGNYTSASVDAGTVHITVNANQQLEEALYGLFRSRAGLVGPRTPVGWRRTADAWRIANLSGPDLPPIPAAVIGQLASDIGEALRSMEQWNGPFPFPQLEVSPLPAALGESWPGLIYLSTMTFVPKDAQQRAGIEERTRFSFTDLMPFHELAHQWWGNATAFASYRDQWIMEGLANYCALMFLDTRRPADRVLAQALEDFRGDLVGKPGDTREPADPVGALALGPRLNSSLTPDGFRRVIYPKATWVVHMIRTMLQEPDAKDPDARFRALLHALLEKHRFGSLAEADLRGQLAAMMRPEMDLEGTHTVDWFFDQWVHSTGIPRYSTEFGVTHDAKGFLVQGRLRQEGVPETFMARVPLYRPNGPGKTVLLGWVVTSGVETPFRFRSAVKPDRILVDPNQTLLAVTE